MNAPHAVSPSTFADQPQDALLVAPSLERRRLQCYLALIITDFASVLLGISSFAYLYLGSGNWSSSFIGAQVALPIYVTIALYNGAYSIKSLADPGRGIMKALAAFLLSAGFVVLVAFLTKSSATFSRVSFTGGVIFAAIILIWSRLQMRSFVSWRCGTNVTNELVVDDGGPQVDLPGAIRVSANRLQLKPDLNDPHALDRIGLVLRNIDRVIVSCPADRRAAWAMMLKGANVEGEVLDDQVARLGAQGARLIGNHGALLVSSGPLGLRSRVVKRLFDLTFAGTAILALSPLLLLVALAIKLEDGGPVLFVQRRTGRGNRFFKMYKFRSMSVGKTDHDAKTLTARDDARVTRVGGFIRRTSIDELPQLLNVLLGDMSLVGPRPHAVGALAGNKLYWEVDLRYWHRHCLKPGLSGLAQVRGFRGSTDNESDLVDRLQSDLEYLEGWTIMRDVQIIFMTLRVVVHDNAF